VAKQMGLPVSRFVVASNANDILRRALASGDHTLGKVEPTLSPSMDIQVSSNFERLLFDAHDRDGAAIRDLMGKLKTQRGFTLDKKPLERIRRDFCGHRVDEEQTLAAISETFRATEMLVDPHTAVGLHAAEQARRAGEVDPATPLVTLATAHPAKFPGAVAKATGKLPPLPEHLADLYEREERYDHLPADLGEVQQYIRQRTHAV
jgi:threonine synthase